MKNPQDEIRNLIKIRIRTNDKRTMAQCFFFSCATDEKKNKIITDEAKQRQQQKKIDEILCFVIYPAGI